MSHFSFVPSPSSPFRFVSLSLHARDFECKFYDVPGERKKNIYLPLCICYALALIWCANALGNCIVFDARRDENADRELKMKFEINERTSIG